MRLLCLRVNHDHLYIIVLCLLTLGSFPESGSAQDLDVLQSSGDGRRITRNELHLAMSQCKGYDGTATTNGARWQAETIINLVRSLAETDDERPLLIDHSDWWETFLTTTNTTPTTAPLFARLANEYGQDMLIEYGSGRVVDLVKKGPTPELATNVMIWWQKRPNRPERYSYDDSLSTPTLKVTNHRVITYRLLVYEDWVFYDKIEGLTGRPTSGVLGFLFSLIGEGRVVENRMAISEDGLQVSRSRAKKAFFGVNATVTVTPDGVTQKDIPDGRPDLVKLVTKLSQDVEIRYLPFR
jgi:hypothetical protein